MNREPAYADVVAGLLDATPPTATERFDAELAEAVANGLDASVARTLRWWQRESVRAVRTHSSTVPPAVITALLSSEAAHAATNAAPPTAVSTTGASPSPSDNPAADDTRRRTLVAGLLSLSDSA
jgi:hypothetical protein